MLRIPHCLYNRLTDGGKVVSPKHRPLSKRQGLVRLEGLGKLKKFIRLIGLELATFRLVAQCLNHYATACLTRIRSTG
jgi:hypothetical protein